MRILRWWSTLPLRLKSLLRGGQADRELDDEFQFHLDHLIDEGIESGLSPDEARLEAKRRMGGMAQRKEEAREARGLTWLTDFGTDVRYAIRSLRRTPGLAALVIVSLALGIGMTAATFSMVDALVFRPYPVPDPDRVVTLSSTSHDSGFENFSYREYLDIRAHTTSYDGVIAYGDVVPIGFSARSGATPRVQAGMVVSANYFDVLRVRPQHGRGFHPDEDQVPGRDAVVVLGRDFWHREFAGDPSVVGRTIRLNGVDFTVIGVAPESFPGMWLFNRVDLYMPLAMARLFSPSANKNFFEDRDDREVFVRGRLKPGITVPQARTELAVLANRFERDDPKLYRGRGATVRTQFEMRTRADYGEWKFAVIFTMLALAVLLVACTNVAGLLLSRASTRTREIAVRLALGAGRFRLIRMLLTESLTLSIVGGLAGVVVGYIGIRLLQTFSIPTTLPVAVPFQMDARVLLACLALSVVSALLCGLAPALQSTRPDLVEGLKAADIDLPGRLRLWSRNVLVVAQVATSLALLTASFLMCRGFQHGVTERTGFTKVAREHVLLAAFDPRLLQYDAARTRRFYDQLTERMRVAPGVHSVGLTENPPLGLESYESLSFAPDGYELPADRDHLVSMMDAIDEGYFESMAIPIVHGRAFLATDTPETPRVAIVNQTFANRYWPNGDAVGKHIRLEHRGGAPVEIVGIAQTVKYREQDKAMDFVYLPRAQHPVAPMVLMVRGDGDPMQLVQPLKDVVRTIDPDMPVLRMRTYAELYRYAAVEGPGVAINLAGTMGAMALVLAIIGLYVLVAYNASRRTHEIGIRMALGATPGNVLRLVMGKGIRLVAIGIAFGLAMSFAVERLMNSMLFDAGGVDLVVYAIVVPGMLLITMLAAYVPARRASRIEPTQALRYE